MENNLEPQIYVSCLAAYNSGYLHGRWIDATQDEYTIASEIQAMLNKSPVDGAEEWAIHDYSDLGEGYISESTSIEDICSLATFIEKNGELGATILGYYNNIKNAEEALNDHYHGEWSSELDYATNLFDEIYLDNLPEIIQSYIDYDAFRHDIFINDYLSLEVNGNVHVFSHH